MLEISNISVNEKRINKYLSNKKRLDGRSSEDFRDITIETGVSNKAEGSARVKIGKTDVIVGIKMDTTEPYPDSPNKGNLMTSAELIPLGALRFGDASTKMESIELGRIIDRGLRESGFIQFEKLCIKQGEKVWNIFVDIYPINDDGNLIDAAGIAAIIALKCSRMPKYDEESGKVLHDEYTDDKIPLSKEIPLSLTVHKIGNNLIVDPCKEEEYASDARITSAGCEERIFSMQKGGKGSVPIELMEEVLDLSQRAREKVILKIKEHLN